MKYKIICQGKIIACFLNKCDRDVCLEALRGTFDDVIFTEQTD